MKKYCLECKKEINHGRPSWIKRAKFCSISCKFVDFKYGSFKKGCAPTRTSFKKGHSTWSKGKKFPEISKRYMGEGNPCWKGGITTQNQLDRSRFRREIQKLVFLRDNFTCQFCGIRGVNLQVDHIQSWSDYVELRFSMDNCRTLCVQCHYKITFGKEMPVNIKTWGHNFKDSRWEAQN